MNISPNPKPHTNSEMDSKTIIKKSELNVAQWETLKEQFVELIVDGMDYKSMEQYVTEQLTNYYDGLSYPELKEDIDNFDEELYNELVDNVTNETVIDNNNTGGKY